MNAIIKAEYLTDIDKHFLIVEPMEQTKEWEDWDLECNRIDVECEKFNRVQKWNYYREEEARKLLSSLCDLGYDGLEVWQWIKTIPKPEDEKSSEQLYPPEPK